MPLLVPLLVLVLVLVWWCWSWRCCCYHYCSYCYYGLPPQLHQLVSRPG